MRSSPWLEHKFYSSAAKNRRDINETWKALEADVDPAFQWAVRKFRKQLNGVLKQYPQTPANDNIVVVELKDLHKEVKKSNGKYNVRLWAAIIDQAESGDLDLVA